MKSCSIVRKHSTKVSTLSAFFDRQITLNLDETAIDFVNQSSKVYCYMTEDRKNGTKPLLLFSRNSGEIFFLTNDVDHDQLRNEFTSFIFDRELVQDSIISYA